MSANLTRIYFGGPLLFEYVFSSLAPSRRLSNYLQTLRMIYTGKGSAFTGYRSAPKGSQAEMHGMREVFPEAVAYAAVQVSPWRLKQSDGFLKGLLRPTMAFAPSTAGTLRIASSSWMFFSTSVLGYSPKIPTIHGLLIPSNS